MNGHSYRAGFTLFETALAVLVISVGILGLFSLFGNGLQMSKSANDDTQVAFFAQTVFNSARAELRQNWNATTFALGENWSEPIRLSSPGNNSTAYKIGFQGGAKDNTINNDLMVWFNYRLTSDPLPDASPDRLKPLRLEVWPGEFVRLTNAVVCYTEVYRMSAQ